MFPFSSISSKVIKIFDITGIDLPILKSVMGFICKSCTSSVLSSKI